MSAFGREALLAAAAIPAIAAVLLLLHHVYFLVLPRRAILKYQEADPERLRRYLARVASTPSLFTPAHKLVALMGLIGVYLSKGQHSEAAAHCRTSLEIMSRSRRPEQRNSLEADIRRRYADCLEALGQADEAEQERQRAAAALDRAAADPLWHLTEGTLLERQNRYEEAYAAFEKALALTPLAETPVRIECIMHLVLAAFNSGRLRDCLRWAEEALAQGASGKFLFDAHRMAAVACGNLGRLEESEQHFRRAYDASAAENNTPVMAEVLATLADCLRKRGNLIEANELCTKAAALHPKALRMSLAVQSHIFREWDRYDDALAALTRHRQTQPLIIPFHERRLMAVVALDTARIEAECGRGSDAWQHIQEAIAVLGDDAKLGLSCEGAACWVLAVRGLADESRRRAGQLEPGLSALEGSPGTCRGVLYDLGMAACVRGDHGAGIDYWTRYLALSPDPVHQPTAHYQRGECYRHLSQLIKARDDYRAAVAMDIDTHHAELAERRLHEVALS